MKNTPVLFSSIALFAFTDLPPWVFIPLVIGIPALAFFLAKSPFFQQDETVSEQKYTDQRNEILRTWKGKYLQLLPSPPGEGFRIDEIIFEENTVRLVSTRQDTQLFFVLPFEKEGDAYCAFGKQTRAEESLKSLSKEGFAMAEKAAFLNPQPDLMNLTLPWIFEGYFHEPVTFGVA